MTLRRNLVGPRAWLAPAAGPPGPGLQFRDSPSRPAQHDSDSATLPVPQLRQHGPRVRVTGNASQLSLAT